MPTVSFEPELTLPSLGAEPVSQCFVVSMPVPVPVALSELEPVEYGCGDARMTGYFARGNSGKAPLVVLGHEAMGVTPLIKSRAAQMVSYGYSAFVMDLYGAEN